MSELSIFGNSLIVDDNGIKLKCVKCRTGKFYCNRQAFNLNTVDRSAVLIGLKKFVKKYYPEWIQILLGLRTNFAYFQRSSDYDKGYCAKLDDTFKDLVYQDDPLYKIMDYQEPVTKMYGDLMRIGNCAECGAFWKNDYDKSKEKEIKESGTCWCCGLPNEYQWHMRTDFETEKEKIKKLIKMS